MEEWWDTTTLCEFFDVDGACCTLVDMTPIPTHNYIGGMTGHKHSDETKEKMRQSALGRDMSKAIAGSIKAHKGKPAHNRGAVYPHLRKTGKLMKDGVVYNVEGVMAFAKEHNLNSSKVGAVLNGKRRSHKGWVLP